jgi:hypothetical protein
MEFLKIYKKQYTYRNYYDKKLNFFKHLLLFFIKFKKQVYISQLLR